MGDMLNVVRGALHDTFYSGIAVPGVGLHQLPGPSFENHRFTASDCGTNSPPREIVGGV